MIEVIDVDVWGFEHAIRGMRNPMNSWDKSDSYFDGYLLVDGLIVGLSLHVTDDS